MCLDLTTSGSMAPMRVAYAHLSHMMRAAGIPMPVNSADAMRRELDCAVIRMLHEILDIAAIPAIQSVKGVFIEGGPLYPGSGIPEKTHIQIAVCDPSCINGVFRVPSLSLN